MKIKTKKLLTTLLKIILFGVFMFLIAWQIQTRTEKYNLLQAFAENFSWSRIYLLFIALVLMPVNIFLESIKWNKLISNFNEKFDMKQAIQSMLCGSFFGFMTPNRVGEFVVRLKPLEPAYRSRALTAGYWGGIAQFLVTFSFGIYMGGKTIVQHANIKSIDSYTVPLAFAIILITSVIYFNLKTVLSWVSKFPLLRKITEKYPVEYEIPKNQLLIILGITLLRYVIYVCQYAIILLFFGVNLPFSLLFSSVSTMLIIHTMFPSVPFIDLGVKGNALMLILRNLTANELGIILSVISIWLINIIIPAIFGYYFFIQTKKKTVE
ncbi:MAG: flippase-like domain-containing protein [Bacteroidetes bacterium]|nr:flippase-like domain-containing protein [Bacteroidota bacterium]